MIIERSENGGLIGTKWTSQIDTSTKYLKLPQVVICWAMSPSPKYRNYVSNRFTIIDPRAHLTERTDFSIWTPFFESICLATSPSRQVRPLKYRSILTACKWRKLLTALLLE